LVDKTQALQRSFMVVSRPGIMHDGQPRISETSLKGIELRERSCNRLLLYLAKSVMFDCSIMNVFVNVTIALSVELVYSL
jgi:hypothetical protein